MVKIEFTPVLEVYDLLGAQPKPATAFIPDWYKNMSPHIFPENKNEIISKTGNINATAKRCSPLLDALTAGYIIPLPADVQVSNSPDEYRITWATSFNVVETHNSNQVANMPFPIGHETQPYKWAGTYSIKTPPGYSVLVIHPSYRFDLPFTTLPGVVDTDKYSFTTIQFPFILREGFAGVIEKGTPIAQVIPFKRDDWSSMLNKYNPDVKHAKDILNSKLVRSYKSRFWSKKRYQ